MCFKSKDYNPNIFLWIAICVFILVISLQLSVVSGLQTGHLPLNDDLLYQCEYFVCAFCHLSLFKREANLMFDFDPGQHVGVSFLCRDGPEAAHCSPVVHGALTPTGRAWTRQRELA